MNETGPLARMVIDTPKSWQALQDYASMGAARSLPKLAERYRIGTDPVPSKQLQTLKRWSAEGGWQARVAAYDEVMAARERAAREAALAERRAAWIERQMEADEVLALLADQGRASLEPFLRRDDEGEIVGFDVSDGKPLHLIKEATITKRQIGDATETTIKIKVHDAKGALDKLGEHHGLFGKKDNGVLKYLDLSKLDADQLERIAAGEDPIHVLINKPDPIQSAS